MKVVAHKTWILTRCISYPPDDFRLQLGQVLGDARKPMRPLFCSQFEMPPQMLGMQVSENQAQDYSCAIHTDMGKTFNLFANLSVVPADAALQAAQSQQMGWQWQFDSLVEKATSFTDEHVRNVVRTRVVQDYIRGRRSRVFGRFQYPELFIITGLRIAKGARMVMSSADESSGGLDAGFKVNPHNVPGLHAGLKAKASKIHLNDSAFNKANDFIFAYQCVQIKYRPKDDRIRQRVFTSGDTLRIAKRQKQDGWETADAEEYDIVASGALRNDVFGAGDGDVEEEDVFRTPYVDVLFEEVSPGDGDVDMVLDP
ncbi:hypothetical protein VTK26DRAFT_9013 [Humicola hyalothermophila]